VEDPERVDQDVMSRGAFAMLTIESIGIRATSSPPKQEDPVVTVALIEVGGDLVGRAVCLRQ
jgi:hypothetical protein